MSCGLTIIICVTEKNHTFFRIDLLMSCGTHKMFSTGDNQKNLQA